MTSQSVGICVNENRFLKSLLFLSRPTVGVSCGGWERGLAVETEKSPLPDKCPKNAARTPRQLHALLGHLRHLR